MDSGNDNGARCDEVPDWPLTLVCVRRAAAGRTCGEHQTIYEKASPVHKSNVAACLRHRCMTHWLICAQVPKFPQIPAGIVPTIVAYAFHTGWY